MFEAFNQICQQVISACADLDRLSNLDLFNRIEQIPNAGDQSCEQHRLFLGKLKTALSELFELRKQQSRTLDEKSRLNQTLVPDSARLGALVKEIEGLGTTIARLEKEVSAAWASIEKTVTTHSQEHTVFEHTLPAADTSLDKLIAVTSEILSRCRLFFESKESYIKRLSFYNALELHQPSILRLLSKYRQHLKDKKDESFLKDYLAAQLDIINPDLQTLKQLQAQTQSSGITDDELAVIYPAIEDLALKINQVKRKVTAKNVKKILTTLLDSLSKKHQQYEADLQQLIDAEAKIKLKTASSQDFTIGAFTADEIKQEIEQCGAFSDFHIHLTPSVTAFQSVCETFQTKARELQAAKEALDTQKKERDRLNTQLNQRLDQLRQMDSQEKTGEKNIEGKKTEINRLRGCLQALGEVPEPRPQPVCPQTPEPREEPPKPVPEPEPKPVVEAPEIVKLHDYRLQIFALSHSNTYLGNWFQAYFDKMVEYTRKDSKQYYHRCCHLLKDIWFELRYGVTTEPESQFSVLNAYFDGFHDDNIEARLSVLLQMKPNLPLPESYSLAANSEHSRQVEKLRQRGYQKEAALFEQVIHYLQALEKIPERQRPDCLSKTLLADPRYDCLKKHRGSMVYRLWEWFAGKLKQLLGSEEAGVDCVKAYSPRFYPSTTSYKLMQQLDRQIAPAA